MELGQKVGCGELLTYDVEVYEGGDWGPDLVVRGTDVAARVGPLEVSQLQAPALQPLLSTGQQSQLQHIR